MKEKISIFDTTLRDGEQSPGASLNIYEKLEIAHQLAKLNVDVIEAGFPISSPAQFDAVYAISSEVEKTIAGLCRANEKEYVSLTKTGRFAREGPLRAPKSLQKTKFHKIFLELF